MTAALSNPNDYIFLHEQLLSHASTDAIHQEMMQLYEKKELQSNRNEYTDHCFGIGNLPSTLAVEAEITKVISDQYGALGKIVFSNTYARIYLADSYLKVHVDRPGLDITLSANIFMSEGVSWPFYYTTAAYNPAWDKLAYLPDSDDTHGVDLKPGQGACILGTKTAHWRKPIHCKPNDYIVQCFWHWSIV